MVHNARVPHMSTSHPAQEPWKYIMHPSSSLQPFLLHVCVFMFCLLTPIVQFARQRNETKIRHSQANMPMNKGLRSRKGAPKPNKHGNLQPPKPAQN